MKIKNYYFCEGGQVFTEGDYLSLDRIKGTMYRCIIKTVDPEVIQDFEELFEAMDNLAVTIRFIDPPLHEFLPHEANDIDDLAREFNISYSELEAHIEALSEMNPMMGNRDCRRSVTYPEIIEMRTKAIILCCNIK